MLPNFSFISESESLKYLKTLLNFTQGQRLYSAISVGESYMVRRIKRSVSKFSPASDKYRTSLPRLHSRSRETVLYCATAAESDSKTASLTIALPNVSSKPINGNAATVKYYPAYLKRLSEDAQDTLQ
jgi:hypothetical protein